MFRLLIYLSIAGVAVCSGSDSDRSGYESGINGICQVTIGNITATSVLVSWTRYAEEYTVAYREGSQCPVANSQPSDLNQRQQTKMRSVTDNSIVLVSLNPNTTYQVIVCGKNKTVLKVGCCHTFRTSVPDHTLLHQVQGVRVHVFNPMVDSEKVSAQVIWNGLDEVVTPTAYDVKITTADENRIDVTDQEFFNLAPHNTFTNIVTRTESNELVYPLQINCIYIVEVRGKNDTANFSWSDPVLIDTKDETFAPELYVVTETATHVLFVNGGANFSYGVKSLFTLDKRNRLVFYLNTTNSVIYKGSINSPFYSKPFFALENADDALSLAYDWIARRLYVAVNTTSATVKSIIFYISDDDNDSSNRQSVFVRSTNRVISEMVVNPFTGFLHWTEVNSSNGYILKAFNLASKDEEKTLKDFLFPALAEDVKRGCVYAIRRTRQLVGVGENCSLVLIDGSTKFNESNSRVFLSTDERGIYAFNGLMFLNYNFDGMLNFQQNISQIQNSAALLGFDVINPGAQPLTNQSCLSPDIRGTITVTLTMTSDTSLLLQWTEPEVMPTDACRSVVVSVPPIMYIVQVSGGDLNNETTQFSRSLELTSIDLSQRYRVRIRARTEFTIGTNEALLADEMIGPFATSVTISTSTTTRSTTYRGISSSSIDITTNTFPTNRVNTLSNSFTPSGSFPNPSSSSLNPFPSFPNSSPSSPNPSPSSMSTTLSTGSDSLTPRPTGSGRASNTVGIVAGVSGGVGVVIISLVAVIILLTVLICVKSRRKPFDRSFSVNEQTERYVRRVSDPSTNGGVNKLVDPSPYESPLTLSSNKSLTDPLLIQQNSPAQGGNVSVDPYAIPSDSLEEYRSSLRNTPPVGQDYEVPVSQTNTLANTTDPKPHPPVNMYSTLDDATTEKHKYASRMSSNLPSNYTALYPPNIDEPHSYVTSTSAPIKVAPELYSQPVVSTRLNSVKRKPPTGNGKRKSRNSHTELPNGPGNAIDNPVYFESSDTKKATGNAYFTLEQVQMKTPQSSTPQALHDVSLSNGDMNRTYFEIERPPKDGAQGHKPEPTYFELQPPQQSPNTNTHSNNILDPKPEPTYFEVQPPQSSSGRTQTISGPKPEPTYFQLQPPTGSTINADSVTPDLKPEPTYSEVEKQKDSTKVGSGRPVYSEPDHSQKQEQNDTIQVAVDGSEYSDNDKEFKP